MNLIMLPFAGANKYSYNIFKPKLIDRFNITIPELPGRSSRFKEAPLTDLDDIVEDVFMQIEDAISEDYIIYAHSMGTLITAVLCQKIESLNLRKPKYLVLTGGPSPTAPKRDRKIRHLLSDDEFKQELRDLGGCPEEVLNNEDLMDYFLPILRTDFQAIETYTYNHTELSIPIRAMKGSNEDITLDELKAWQNVTSADVNTEVLEGDHFFIFKHLDHIVKVIHDSVSEKVIP